MEISIVDDNSGLNIAGSSVKIENLETGEILRNREVGGRYLASSSFASFKEGAYSIQIDHPNYDSTAQEKTLMTQNCSLESLSISLSEIDQSVDILEFAGFFFTDVSNQACVTENPLTNTCGCSAGYTATNIGPYQQNENVVPAFRRLNLNYCSKMSSGLGNFFGGLYVVNAGTNVCDTMNPATSDCSCPAGFTDMALETYQRSQAAQDSYSIHSCYNLNEDLDSSHFGGMYSMEANTAVCNLPNPFSNDCTCPDGFNEVRTNHYHQDATNKDFWSLIVINSLRKGDPKVPGTLGHDSLINFNSTQLHINIRYTV